MKTYYIGNSLPFDEGIIYCTVEESLEILRKQEVLGIDIETSRKFKKGTYREDNYRGGLDPWLTRIVMLQIGTQEVNFVIDARVVDLSAYKGLLESSRLFVGANLKFECKHLLHGYGIRIKNIWDVMLVEMNLYNGIKQSYSLLNIAKRYFNVLDLHDVDLFTLDTFNTKKKNWEEQFWTELDNYIIDKSIRLQFINIGDRPFTKSQILYGVDDIVLPLRIREKQIEGREVNGEIYNPVELHVLENKVCKALAQIELNGIPFDVPGLLKLDKKNRGIYLKRVTKLNEWVENNHSDFCNPSLFGGGTCKIKWTAPAQVIPLFKKLNICPEEKSKSTGKISPTVGAVALTKLLDKEYRSLYENRHYNGIEDKGIENSQDLIIHYLLFKEAQQLIKTFGKAYLKYVHPITGRVHPNFFQILATGRLSSSRPNMMQWPSQEEYRSIVKSKYKFITVDYSSQEIRILAQVSGVKAMIEFFTKGSVEFGSDFHSFTASRVARLQTGDPTVIITKKTDPEARQRAKITNFSINYGAGPPNLAAQFGCSIEEAEEFMLQYIRSWEGLQEDFDRRQQSALKKGYIQLDNVIERRWFCPDFERIAATHKKAWAYYPDDYRFLSRQEKADFKKDLYERHPTVKELWREHMKLKGSLERRALNYPIQSTAGSMTKYAVVKIMDYIESNKLWEEIKIVNIVHDEINAESFKNHERNADIIIKSMEYAGSSFCPDVPMVAEGEINTYWSK